MSELDPSLREIAANRQGWTMAMVAALLLLCTWGVIVSRVNHPTRFWNFAFIHDGALCFEDRCDPYDTHFLDHVGQRHGEPARPALNPEYPVYPPSTLLLASPLNGAGWPAAGFVFFGLSLLVYGLAIAFMVRSVRSSAWVAGSVVLLALVSSRSPWLGLFDGNPVVPCAGLVTLSCVLLLMGRRHEVAATVLLFLALSLKPQLAVGAVVFLLWRRDTRRAALWALFAFGLFSLVGVVAYGARLRGFGYLATESRVLRTGFLPGHSSDGSLQNPNAFRFLNLEPLMSGLHLGARAAKWAAFGVTAASAFLLVVLAKGKDAIHRRPWTMFSLLLLLSLMPLYHREYDRCLLLALAPAAMECEGSRWLRWLVPVAALLWFWSEPLIPMLLPMFQLFPCDALFTLLLFGLLCWSLKNLPPAMASAPAA